MMRYSGSNVSRSTPMPLLGRSLTCPIDAFTMKPSPRYLLIVLALAGDSTITRFLPFFLAIATRDNRPVFQDVPPGGIYLPCERVPSDVSTSGRKFLTNGRAQTPVGAGQ